VSSRRIEACRVACEPHGGIAWVVAAEAATYDCICRDLSAIELEGVGW
jgi:hypothetical protein